MPKLIGHRGRSISFTSSGKGTSNCSIILCTYLGRYDLMRVAQFDLERMYRHRAPDEQATADWFSHPPDDAHRLVRGG